MQINRAANLAGYPPGAVPVAAQGNGVNAIATATLAAAANKLNYLTSLQITGYGATAAAAVTASLTGCLGGGIGIDMGVPAGVNLTIQPVILTFNPPLPASAVNTAIVLTVPAFGAGNPDVRVSLQGYQL